MKKAKAIVLGLQALALAKMKAAAAHAMLIAALAKAKIVFSKVMMANFEAMFKHVKLQIEMKMRMMLSMLLARLKLKLLWLWKLRLMLPKFKLAFDLSFSAAEVAFDEAQHAADEAESAAAAAKGLQCFPPNPVYSDASDATSQSVERQRQADCNATRAADQARQSAAATSALHRQLVQQTAAAMNATARCNQSIAVVTAQIADLQRQIDAMPALQANRTDTAMALLNASLDRAHMDAGLFILGSKRILLNPVMRQVVASEFSPSSLRVVDPTGEGSNSNSSINGSLMTVVKSEEVGIGVRPGVHQFAFVVRCPLLPKTTDRPTEQATNVSGGASSILLRPESLENDADAVSVHCGRLDYGNPTSENTLVALRPFPRSNLSVVDHAPVAGPTSAMLTSRVLSAGFDNDEFMSEILNMHTVGGDPGNPAGEAARMSNCARAAVIHHHAVRQVEIKLRLTPANTTMLHENGHLSANFRIDLWGHAGSRENDNCVIVNEPLSKGALPTHEWKRVGTATATLSHRHPIKLLRFFIDGDGYNKTLHDRMASGNLPPHKWTHFVVELQPQNGSRSERVGIELLNFWSRVDVKNVSSLGIGVHDDVGLKLHLHGADSTNQGYDSGTRVEQHDHTAIATLLAHHGPTKSLEEQEQQAWLNESSDLLKASDGFPGSFDITDASIDLDELLTDPSEYLATRSREYASFLELMAQEHTLHEDAGPSDLSHVSNGDPSSSIGEWSVSSSSAMMPFPQAVVQDSETSSVSIEEFRSKQLVQALAKADTNTVGHTAGLGKTLIEELAHVLTTKLAIKTTDLLTKSLTPRITETVTNALEDDMVQQISASLTQTLPLTLSRATSVSLPAVLSLWLPTSLRQNLARSLAGVMGRGLTHSLAPSIFMSIKASKHSVVFPRLSSQLDHADANDGQSSHYAQADVLKSALYYMDIYASYYSDYYSDIFASSSADFLTQKPSELQTALAQYNTHRRST